MAQAPQTSAPAQPQTPPPGAPQTPGAPLPTLEQSFELLKEFKLGTDSTGLIPIERAVMEVHGNETARAALEKRLVGATRKAAHWSWPFAPPRMSNP